MLGSRLEHRPLGLEVKRMLWKLFYIEGWLVERLADVALQTSRHDEFTVLLVVEVGVRLLDGTVGMPISPEYRTINVVDFPWPLFYVVLVHPLVYTPICPCEHSITLFLVRLPLALILVTPAHALFPNPLPASQSCLEIPFEKATRCPIVLPVS